MITSDPRWSDEVLDASRLIGDPLADHSVEEIFAADSVAEVNRLLRNLVRNDMPPPEELPVALQNYFITTQNLPAWADLDAIARSQKFFMRHGLLSFLILTCYSLPVCYAAASGVKVLYESARLYSNPRRRVLETSQMILDSLVPGGLAPSGIGVRSAQKVRLMHAAIRALLIKRGWDSVNLGVPINQEDLVLTQIGFGFYFLDGLRKLNVRFSVREADDYIHTWNVLGDMMGIQRSLHPQNFAEATCLAERINERHFSASLEGRVMQESLTSYLQSILPGTVFDGFPIAITRHFIGEERANVIGLPRSDWTRLSLMPFRIFNGLIGSANEDIPSLAQAARYFNQKMIENLLVIGLGNQPTNFHIPETLRKAWKIEQVGYNAKAKENIV